MKMALKLADNKLRNLRRNMLMKMVLRQKVKKEHSGSLKNPNNRDRSPNQTSLLP